MLLLLYYSKELQLCNRCETFFKAAKAQSVSLSPKSHFRSFGKRTFFVILKHTLWYFLHIYLNACVSLSLPI